MRWAFLPCRKKGLQHMIQRSLFWLPCHGAGVATTREAAHSPGQSEFISFPIDPGDTAAWRRLSAPRSAGEYQDSARGFLLPVPVRRGLFAPRRIERIHDGLRASVTGWHVQVEQARFATGQAVELSVATAFSYQGVRVRGPVYFSLLGAPLAGSGLLTDGLREVLITDCMRRSLQAADLADVTVVRFPYHPEQVSGATYRALSALAVDQGPYGYLVADDSVWFYLPHGSGAALRANRVAARRLMTDQGYALQQARVVSLFHAGGGPLSTQTRNPMIVRDTRHALELLIGGIVGLEHVTLPGSPSDQPIRFPGHQTSPVNGARSDCEETCSNARSYDEDECMR